MGKRILLDVSPTGIQHSVEVDEDGFYYEEHTPSVVENEILDECSRLRGLAQNRTGNFKFAGKIPLNTHAAWRKEWQQTAADKMTWPTFLAIKMNNRDNKKLRVDDGALPTTSNLRMI
jgi:hypothetical protein